MLIARLACELHCCIPEELDEAWAQLRHLGRRRVQQITAAPASVQRLRDFLSVAWPWRRRRARTRFEPVTWLAVVQVVTSRSGGQPETLAAMGLVAFTVAVRGGLGGWGGQRVAGQVCRAVFAALTDTESVIITHRRGLLRRCAEELDDLQRVRAELRETEADMTAVLGELGPSRLGGIPGLTAVGAARSWRVCQEISDTLSPCR